MTKYTIVRLNAEGGKAHQRNRAARPPGKDEPDGAILLAEVTTPVSMSANITITGAHRRFLHANLTVGEGRAQSPKGTTESELNGTCRSGLPAPGACPKSLPHPLPVRAHVVVRRGSTRAVMTVGATPSISGAGIDERGVDGRPIESPTVLLAGRRFHTNRWGQVRIRLGEAARRRYYRMLISAGDTFLPVRMKVGIPARQSVER